MLGVSAAIAQQPGDSRPLADKGSVKGRTELRREKRILRNERKHTRKSIDNHVQRDKSKGKFGVIKFKKHKKNKKDKNNNEKGAGKPKL